MNQETSNKPNQKRSLKAFESSSINDVNISTSTKKKKLAPSTTPISLPNLSPEFAKFIKTEFKKNSNYYKTKIISTFVESKTPNYYNVAVKYRNHLQETNSGQDYVDLFNDIFNQQLYQVDQIPINILSYIIFNQFIHFIGNSNSSNFQHYWKDFTMPGLADKDIIEMKDVLESFKLINSDATSNQLREMSPESLFKFAILSHQLVYTHSFNKKLVNAVNEQGNENTNWNSISNVFENKIAPIVIKNHFEDLNNSKLVIKDGARYAYDEKCMVKNTGDRYGDIYEDDVQELKIPQKEFNPIGVYMKEDVYDYSKELFEKGHYLIVMRRSTKKYWSKLSEEFDILKDTLVGLHKEDRSKLICLVTNE
ncbi:uncharacterized protein KGF55_004030 [Candida pseudojiufengensis]|uniref:uncharacterized protein n=1 Tax=Candida pseudojiufengensis TaxID=497109 RepID=UPI002223F6CE|nr:uncharacterized protein KGF55_004030 [Candida pseudojiufengensis]KAI5961407.1 hypothetical protein KGF55_004030 [Candida pseudojiufengensis]